MYGTHSYNSNCTWCILLDSTDPVQRCYALQYTAWFTSTYCSVVYISDISARMVRFRAHSCVLTTAFAYGVSWRIKRIQPTLSIFHSMQHSSLILQAGL